MTQAACPSRTIQSQLRSQKASSNYGIDYIHNANIIIKFQKFHSMNTNFSKILGGISTTRLFYFIVLHRLKKFWFDDKF